jgi:hypothetical protein
MAVNGNSPLQHGNFSLMPNALGQYGVCDINIVENHADKNYATYAHFLLPA